MLIDVAACLEQIDELLLATPVRNGRAREVRLSLSPAPTGSSMPAKRRLAYADGEEDTAPLLVPVEIMLEILGHLPAESLGCLRRVCKRCVMRACDVAVGCSGG